MYQSKDQMVSNPSHYKLIPDKDVEVLDVIKAATKGLSGYKAVDTAQAIKYILRWNKKGKPLQDVEKAIFYLTDLKEELEKEADVEHISCRWLLK